MMAGKHGIHSFTPKEVALIRKGLLNWYDVKKRQLPWREKVLMKDDNERAYAVWVSEIMLQQTQVATVIDYYNKWMAKWPTLESLSKASLEEVNEMWSGLGYYSRGRRLYEGSQKVVTELKGQMPHTAASLEKQLPGVGRYTAGAVASIAFGECTGVVDGNVVRVFSRMRAIGADCTAQETVDTYWSLAHATVDPDRPGDFNQALMELGAIVCTPKTPSCSQCPVANICIANAQVERQKKENASKLSQKPQSNSQNQAGIPDIECAADGCKLCLPNEESYDESVGVMNYPRKPKKKPPREEQTTVNILYRTSPKGVTEYLLVQRPPTGLLANLWEFPSLLQDSKNCENGKTFDEKLLDNFGVCSKDITDQLDIGPVVHIFSHIHQTYNVKASHIKDLGGEIVVCERATRWLPRDELLQSALSTAMKKVFRAFDGRQSAASKTKGTKRKSNDSHDGKKQLGLAAFFKPKLK